MSRSLSTGFRTALFAQENGQVVASLVTIEHASLVDPIRLSTDSTIRLTNNPITYGTISRGEQYLFFPMNIVQPEDSQDAEPIMSIEIDNIHRDLVPLVRSIEGEATLTLEVILAANPDTVEITFPQMLLVDVDYNSATLTIRLAVDGLYTEPYPGVSYTPSHFPGLF